MEQKQGSFIKIGRQMTSRRAALPKFPSSLRVCNIRIGMKQGNAPKPTREQKERSVISKEDWNTYFSGHWYFAGVKQDKHIAMFPEEFPARLIKMFAFVGDIVLDPFLGRGTTSLAGNRQTNPSYTV